MKQTLQLRLGQQLAMTPQLQQAIRLLQLSTLDLRQEIQQVVDSNMMLEIVDDNESPVEPSAAAESTDGGELPPASDAMSRDSIPEELPVDAAWEDVFDNVQASASGAQNLENYEIQHSAAQTLQDYLKWQMELTPFNDQDCAIATAIIDSINQDGYLGASIDEIHQGLLSQIRDLELAEVVAVLHRVQNFDPPGVGACGPAECLRIQLQQLPASTPWRETALQLVEGFLDHLAAQDQTGLKRLLGLTDDQLADVIALIRSLEPHPGRAIAGGEAQYVIPDVFVTKKNGVWQVSLNPDIAPKLRVNPFYSSMIKRADNSVDNVCMKNHLQEARWFLKSLQSRSETLLKVARCIVDHQTDFLEHGPVAMKPLVLRDIAEAVDMHESTISRVTTQKYMHTPKGIFEFKYFFSSHVATADGGECSATAIRAFIKELIDREDVVKPLSDKSLSTILKDRGINVARRTVAKYREAMSIPPSNQRKRIL